MKKFFNCLVSTDFKSILMKLPVFFVLMVLTFFDPTFELIALFVLSVFMFLEFSYNSIIWLLLYILCPPYTSIKYILLLLVVFVGIGVVRMVQDIREKRVMIKKWPVISMMVISGVILLLFLLPIAPNYNFMMSMAESMAVVILSIFFINYKKIDVKMIMKIMALFILSYCLAFNILGVLGLCHYKKIPYAGLNRFSLFLNDPNYTAGLVLIALISICILHRTQDIKHWFFYTLFIIGGVCLINTISKAAFIVYVILVITLIINKAISIVKTKTRESVMELVYLIVSIIAVCLLSFRATGAMVSRMFSFTQVSPEEQVAELTTGRGDLILIYLKGVFDTPYEAVFGHGILAPLLAFAEGDYRTTHCLALSLAYRHGLLVSVLLVAMYIIAYMHTKQKPNWFNICMAGLLLLMYMSLSVFIFSQLYVFVMLFICAVGIVKKDSVANMENNKVEKKYH